MTWRGAGVRAHSLQPADIQAFPSRDTPMCSALPCGLTQAIRTQSPNQPNGIRATSVRKAFVALRVEPDWSCAFRYLQAVIAQPKADQSRVRLLFLSVRVRPKR